MRRLEKWEAEQRKGPPEVETAGVVSEPK
jgi:hypothetical protein